MSKEKFERTKPKINVNVDNAHSKTELEIALAKQLSNWRKWRQSGHKNQDVICGIKR